MSTALSIYHRLLYEYESPVLLGPQRLNLWPRLGLHQRLRDYQLSICPEPSGLYSELDAEGNPTQWAYFNGPASRLEIILQTTIRCYAFDPHYYVIYPFESARLPFEYEGALARLLDNYRMPSRQKGEVADWAAALQEEASGETVAFLELLCRRLHEDFTYTLRKDGPPHDPLDTFLYRRGSCRDLSTLMIEACQTVGLAARFVSGYAWTEREVEKNELHAWVEVYLPGAGWRGFDPTQGGPITPLHVAVAASAYQERTVPVSGTYSGEVASSLSAEVALKTV